MRYFLRQTWNNVMASWGIALQAVVVMSIAFFLLGSFGLLALQIEVVLQHWESEAPVIIYLKDGLNAKDHAGILSSLKRYQEVKAARLVTPQQAMKRMKNALGKRGNLLDGMDAPILPTTIEIDLKQWARSPKALKQIRGVLSKVRGAQEVDIGQRWFAPLWELVRWVRIILFGGSALLLFAACLIAAGTIRLALFVHRDEIGIMRLLGATEGFIRFPFFLEGALKGIFAAMLAIALIYPIFLSLEASYGASFLAFTSTPLRFFAPVHMAALIGGGFIAGCIGSWLAFLTAPSTPHDSPA